MSSLTTTMEMEKCPVCGVDIRSREKFCWNCGKSLHNDLSSPQPEQPGIWTTARLVMTTSAGEILQEYLLNKAEVIIGRATSADIALFKDNLASRRHASVRNEQGHYVLHDEYSANGTFVNGEQLEAMVPYQLQDGDQVEIGEHLLVFYEE